MEHLVESSKQHEHGAGGPGGTHAVARGASSIHPVLQLQQQAGNQAVQELLRSGVIQAKLAISNPDDPDEREADHVAHTIMRAPAGFPASTPCACSHDGEMCEECQQKQTTIHRRASAPTAPSHVPRVVSDVLHSPGHPLDSASRAFFEPRFGHDFSDVRIHTGPEAAESARSINAVAYAMGPHIAFSSGQYAPDTNAGRALLAHELTHVVQQSSANGITWRQPDEGCSEPGSLLSPVSHASEALIQRQPTTGDKRFGDAPKNLPEPSRPNFPFGYSKQQSDANELRFTNRFFPSGQYRPSCPHQACHSPSNLPAWPAPPDRRVTEPRLLGWALEVGTTDLLTDASLVILQTKPGTNDELVRHIHDALIKSVLASHDFEGSDEARQDFATALALRWGEVGPTLRTRLSEWFQEMFVAAFNRAPTNSVLETHSVDIIRILTHPYGHKTPLGRWGQWAQIKERYGNILIADIEQSGPWEGTVWFNLPAQPQWFYRMSTVSFRQTDPFVSEVARQVDSNTAFAKDLFPLLLKVGAFSLGLSGRLAFVVGSIVVDEFAEEFRRDVHGEQHRSLSEIFTSAAKSLLIDRVMNRLFGGAEKAFAAEAALDEKIFIGLVEEPSAKAIRQELANAEATEVADALRAGGGRPVEDAALKGDGYVVEVEIAKDGERHFYRQFENGVWCRFTKPICNIDLHLPESALSPTARFRQLKTKARPAGWYRDRLVLERLAEEYEDVVRRFPHFEDRLREIGDALRKGETERAARLSAEFDADAQRLKGFEAPGSELGRERFESRPDEPGLSAERPDIHEATPSRAGLKGSEAKEARDELTTNMGPRPSNVPGGWQRHHIIPLELRQHPLVERMKYEYGWNINGKKNGVWLPASEGVEGYAGEALHYSSHPHYTKWVGDRLDLLYAEYKAGKISETALPRKFEDLIGEFENNVRGAAFVRQSGRGQRLP